MSEAWRATAERLWARHELARSGPKGTWAQRWIPGVCKHQHIRCTHGDEIIQRNFRRRVCLDCGRSLCGDLPRWCWFSETDHYSMKESGE